MLQGAARRGVCSSPDPFFHTAKWAFSTLNLHPHEGKPLKHHLSLCKLFLFGWVFLGVGWLPLKFQARLLFLRQKRHMNFEHISLLKRQLTPGQPAGQPKENDSFPAVRRRTHKLVCPVNRPLVPGSTGPSPEQKVYVYVPFSPIFFKIQALRGTSGLGPSS